MKSTAVLAALTCLASVAARPLPTASAALSKRGGGGAGTGGPDGAGPSGLAVPEGAGVKPGQVFSIGWNKMPDPYDKSRPDNANWPKEHRAWEDAACLAMIPRNCFQGRIAGGPHNHPDGRYIWLDTEKEKGLRVLQDGTVAHSPSFHGLDWESGSNHGQLSPEAKEAWGRNICTLKDRTGCKEMRVTSGPHDGADALGFAKYGPHVHVDTDQHKDLKVYADGTVRHPQGQPLFSWADSSNHKQLSPEDKEAWKGQICHITGKMGCSEMMVTSGPHDGTAHEGHDAFALHRGQHVHVKTDKYKDMEVYVGGLARIKHP